MQPDSALRDLRVEFETRLEKVQDRLLTAVFGFVNGASARMERLEDVDKTTLKAVADLERRVRTLERQRRRPAPKKPK